MDWALSGLQLVFGGNKWSGRHVEYTTLARETPMVEHLGNLFGEKWPRKISKSCFLCNVYILVSQKEWCYTLVFAFLLTHRSERWKPSVAVMYQSTFTLRGRFEEAGEVWWWWHQKGTPCLVCFMSGLPPGGFWLVCLSQNTAVSDRRPPAVCRYPDRTNHTKLSLFHLDLVGCLWWKCLGRMDG